MNLDAAVKELQDAMTVMAHLEKRQSEMLREHAEFISQHDQRLAEISAFQRRTDQNLAEITDKLNGLIGYIDGYKPPQ